MSTIDARQAAEAAELFARCLRAWRRHGSYTEAARRLGVTSRFLREAVERAEAQGIQADDSAAVRVYKPRVVEPDVYASPAEEKAWLRMVAQGEPIADVAALAGVPIERIRLGMDRARDCGLSWVEARKPWNPHVAILIPQDYRPSSPCPHDGPIARGRRAYCVVCDRSGLDHETGMQIDPEKAPKPEPKVPKLDDQAMTRAQRRKLLAELTADQRKEILEADRDARRARRGKAEWERRGDNMGR